MSGKRMGERLSGLVPLSGHDIEEILTEQHATGRRFGDIALRMGLCGPEHVLQAWCSQLAEKPQRIDLDRFSIDTQAITHLTPEFAARYHVIPLRVLGDELILAIDEAAYPEGAREVVSILQRKVQFVLCSHKQISQALRVYYTKISAA